MAPSTNTRVDSVRLAECEASSHFPPANRVNLRGAVSNKDLLRTVIRSFEVVAGDFEIFIGGVAALHPAEEIRLK